MPTTRHRLESVNKQIHLIKDENIVARMHWDQKGERQVKLIEKIIKKGVRQKEIIPFSCTIRIPTSKMAELSFYTPLYLEITHRLKGTPYIKY